MWTSLRCPLGSVAASDETHAPSPAGKAAYWPAPSDDDGECSTCAPYSRQVTPGVDGGHERLLHAALASLPHFAAAARLAVEVDFGDEDDSVAAGRMAACARRLALGSARAAAAASRAPSGKATAAAEAPGAPGAPAPGE